MPLFLLSPPTTDGLNVVFEAGHRAWRVRFIMILSLILGVGGLYAAYNILFVATFEGEAVSLGERIALGALCGIPALAFVIGMDVYGRCYVVRIERKLEDTLFIYTTLNWIGYRQELISEDERGELKRHPGKWSLPSSAEGPVTPSVNAPYSTLKFRHRKLPYILDDAGVFFK